MTAHNIEKVKEAISMVGSGIKLARCLNIGVANVYSWTANRSEPSPITCLKIQKLTEGRVRARDLLPLFEWDSIYE